METDEMRHRRRLDELRQVWHRHRDGVVVNLVFSILVPLVTLLVTEWIARGTLGAHQQGNGFFQALSAHFPSFLLAYILLVCVYIFISQLSGLHALAVGVLGLLGIVPATVTYFKLTMRGEPFFPWDILQIGDLMGISSEVSFRPPSSLFISIGIFILLVVLALFVRVPRGENGKADWISRGVSAGAALACGVGLMFLVFLSGKGSEAMGIRQDMWMQERYYRNHGVITAFLTNLQMLQIDQPEGYGEQTVQDIAAEVEQLAGDRPPLYENSFAAGGGTVEDPDIIYVMAEGFWDVTALPGIEYDQPLLQNYERLSAEGYYGTAYSPSFGGGTCDVEFEALTGFSMEYLPTGSKPFQQYITEDTTSLPHFLKEKGYQTTAIHGYGRRFWNRDVAYPRLGIDKFVASEDFVDPHRRRGFISDEAMVDQIIREYEHREADAPVFIHAVTMQNHTTYSPARYPAGELVRITRSPDTVSASVVGQLEDCATGIREMDAALGRLCDYLRNSERPTIVVFWGDHMNPMSDGYGIFEATGYIQPGDTTAPQMHLTPMLIWSNFENTGGVALGTLSTYNLSPVMLDLYGQDMPLVMEFLAQQYPYLQGRTKGVTLLPGGGYSEVLDERQQQAFDGHAILQYDYMFGHRTLEDYIKREDE